MRKITLTVLVAFLFGFAANAQTTIFEDDFESYNVGDFIAQSSDDWDTWTGSPGSSEDAVITDAYNNTSGGSNSLEIVSGNDIVYFCDDKTSGVYDVNFWYYMPSGQGGYFNIQHEFGANWAFSVNFLDGGNAELSYDNSTIENFTYTQDAWIPVMIHVDLDNDEVTLNVEGNDILTWQFSTSEGGSGALNVLDCVNFYGYADVNPPYYVDDFEFIEVQGGSNPPEIELSATSFDISETTNETLTISNTGEEDLVFDALVYYPQPEKYEYSKNNQETHVVSDKQKFSTLSSNAKINGTSIQEYNYNSKDDVELKHFNPNDDMLNSLGWGGDDPVDAEAVALFKYDNNATSGVNLKDYIGMELVNVLVYVADAPVSGSSAIEVYNGRDGVVNGPMNLITSESFDATANNQSFVPLTEPVYIDGKDLFVGWSFTQNPGEHCIGMESDDSPTEEANWTNTGVAWSSIDNPDWGDFGIVAFLTGTPMSQWLTLDVTTGTVAPSGSQDITVQVDATGLDEGTYEATIVVKANDNDDDESYNEIPVTLDLVDGINETGNIELTTYPNPTNDFFNVSANNTINTLKIVNLAGQIVKDINVHSKEYQMDVSSLNSGVYLVKIEMNSQTISKKLHIK